MSTQNDIRLVCNQIEELLLAKNAKYGDSALQPVRIFSKATPVEQILVRIDDKLSRISKGVGLLAADEDVLQDLIGYLVLLKIAKQREKSDQWDGSDIEPAYNHWTHAASLLQDPGILESADSSILDLHTSGDQFS
jgi:hypothetical protein